MHRKGPVVEFFPRQCGNYLFTEKQAVRYFNKYNQGSREGYEIETVRYD